MTLDQVADELGCSRSTVHRHLRRVGVARRKGGPPELPAATEDVVRLRRVGRSWAEIGAAVGLTGEGARSRYLSATTGRNRVRTVEPWQ